MLAATALQAAAKAATPAPAQSGASGGYQQAGLNDAAWTVNIGENAGAGLNAMELALFAGAALGVWLIIRKR